MREHPIPQDITGYRFHIIGNMTLKQFGELGLGIILAVVVFASNLPLIIKWPFIILFVILGIVAAFVPIGERPLDHWILTFFKVLYRPTLYFWKKEEHIPDAFTYKSVQTVVLEPELDLTPARRQRIKEYISSVSYSMPVLDEFEADETDRLQSILNSFDTITVAKTTVVPSEDKPTLEVRVRTMRNIDTVSQNLPPSEINLTQPQPKSLPISDQLPMDPMKQMLQTDQVAQEIQIPQTPTMKIDSTALTDQDIPIQTTTQATDQAYVEYSHAPQENPQPTSEAQYNTNLPFPTIPDTPNKPVGMVLSDTGDLITGAIVEIKTQSGTTARAVKTNALGQFFVTTPLTKGLYTLETECPGYVFEQQSLEIKDEIVQPLEIRGKKAT